MGYEADEDDIEICKADDVIVYHDKSAGIFTVTERSGIYHVMMTDVEAIAAAKAILRHYQQEE